MGWQFAQCPKRYITHCIKREYSKNQKEHFNRSNYTTANGDKVENLNVDDIKIFFGINHNRTTIFGVSKKGKSNVCAVAVQ